MIILLKQLKSIIASLNNNKKKGQLRTKKGQQFRQKNGDLNVIKINTI